MSSLLSRSRARRATTTGAAKALNPRHGHGIRRRIAVALLGLAACPPPSVYTGTTRFLVYYGADDDPAIADYDVAVLDAEADGALLARRARSATFLGYLSLCEIHTRRSYFAELAEQGVLIERNPSWPDAWYVDFRSERWRKHVLERLVPELLRRGFEGVFLDTLDDAEHLELRDRARFAGMVEHAAELVREIRRRFPRTQIMVNRGYAVLPRIAGQFDMLLGESVRATYVAASNAYALVSDDDYEWQRRRMWEARNRDPRLRLFSLDYWAPDDREGIARLYAEQRANGFVPYVATPDLARIVPAPG